MEINSLNPTPFPDPHNQIPPLRIADLLLNSDDDHGYHSDDSRSYRPLLSFLMDGVGNRRRDRSSDKCKHNSHCSSPRRIIARCFSALRPAKERKTEERPVSDLPVSAPESEDSGQCKGNTSFNLGIACGLLYLIGTSKNEMNKMIEMRKQMEMFLHNIRDEFRNKSNLAYSSNNNFRESSSSNTHLSPLMNFTGTTSYVVPDSETILECDDSISTDLNMNEQRLGEMDELEAELEAEFERLQLRLDTEHSQHQSLKVVMNTAYSENQSLSYVEVIDDPQELCTEELENGVRPIELERKLYQLLELRQEERIKELEEALECANHKLKEKELEVSWWKDTAHLISQHIPQR
ncbi:hypothetical protein F8388_019135 [Cannabis sativa]|uniref:Protein POLAR LOCALIZATION DURING ASYMMETRIC DIVISION AND REDISTRIBUTION n=1 Tax=Cannabis sativa TaxID=3483 RepID=A0A7J6DT52_CANSA|nr:hypothetical protein F8388_019135 [Cannabis sativa]